MHALDSPRCRGRSDWRCALAVAAAAVAISACGSSTAATRRSTRRDRERDSRRASRAACSRRWRGGLRRARRRAPGLRGRREPAPDTVGTTNKEALAKRRREPAEAGAGPQPVQAEPDRSLRAAGRSIDQHLHHHDRSRARQPRRRPPRQPRRRKPAARQQRQQPAAGGAGPPARLPARNTGAATPAAARPEAAARPAVAAAPAPAARASAEAGATDGRHRDLRALRAGRPARVGRHVDRLQGDRPGARADRRRQGARRAPLRRRASSWPGSAERRSRSRS